jgi:hypothetical protein
VFLQCFLDGPFKGQQITVMEVKEFIVKATLVAMRNIVGTAGLVFAAYVVAGAMPDLRRYLKIVRM